MAILTERVSVTLPADLATQVRQRARQKGVSLSTVMRDIVDDLIAEHDLAAAFSKLEQRDATAR